MSVSSLQPCTLRTVLHSVFSSRETAFDGGFFPGGQPAAGSLRQVAEAQLPTGNTHQTQDFHAELFQNAANLPVLALVQDDFKPGIAFTAPQFANALHAEQIASVSDAQPDRLQQWIIRDCRDLHMIRFGY